MMKKLKTLPPKIHAALVGLLLAALFLFPLLGFSQYVYRVCVISVLYAILAMSLNLIAGVAGQISLGHIAFYGIGAYTSALLCVNLGVSVWLGILAAFLISMLFGLLIAIPTLKLSGGYLAILTMSFAEIIRLILLNWTDVTRGPMGILNIPKPKLFGYTIKSSAAFLYLVIIIAIVVYIALRNLIRSKFGRNLKALRDDEISSESMGINVYRHKVIAFVISTGIAGIAGALYASYMEFIDPTSFISDESTVILSMVVLGGMGNMNGSIIAAILLTVLPEALRSFSDYRMLVYGVVLVVMMLLKITDWGAVKRALKTAVTFKRER
ncbi:branched-chain amino acid ABC transporter permease [Anaerotruncus colihominis]|jgi:branched-chain amino acid transport system permease protein|nr:branched-chain amino acid ABC transporter permease [Anaerotruncus colihominis]MCI8493826.1 branched-chain amino acid ABC transporter permease [Anaerotruncus sp.]MCR2024762.1 branched-chain amino acid ABC transporter permease [Anaerotruncus colihominis]NDO38176.1 branched-chain amino acid ABC transporter permease [Anaerotruncus colihominis]